jgi:hypothetical protein
MRIEFIGTKINFSIPRIKLDQILEYFQNSKNSPRHPQESVEFYEILGILRDFTYFENEI